MSDEAVNPTETPSHVGPGGRSPVAGPEYERPGAWEQHYADPGPGSAHEQPAPGGHRAPAPARPGAQRFPAGRRRVTAGLAGLALVAGGIGGGIGALTGGGSSSVVATAATATSNSVTVQAAASGTIAAAAQVIEPSVVTLTVNGTVSSDLGSGIIVRSDGYILTNDHVIADGGTITVTLSDGKTYPARIVGENASSDLAVVKIAASGLRAATFADSSKVVVGDLAVAVGSPLGLSNTVTSGVVSALNRTIDTTTASDTGTGATIRGAIQTDAAINPGNSGGALVNAQGQVIGVTSAIASTSSGQTLFGRSAQSGNIGVGFAIPSDTAARVAAQLISASNN